MIGQCAKQEYQYKNSKNITKLEYFPFKKEIDQDIDVPAKEEAMNKK